MNNLANNNPETECTPATGGDYDCSRVEWLTSHSVIISGYARAYEAASDAGDMQNASKYLDIMNNLANTVNYFGYSEWPGCHAYAIKAYTDAYITAVKAGDDGNASYYLAVMHNISKTDPADECAPASGTDYSCGWSNKMQGLMILAYARAYEAATLAGDDENASLYLNITKNLANTTASDTVTCKPIEGTYSCDCAGNQESLISGYAQMQLMEGTESKGTVPTTIGAEPFYTVNNNPQTCLNMKDEDTCERSWTVNATGDIGTAWEFYTIYEPVSYPDFISAADSSKILLDITDYLPGSGVIQCENGMDWVNCSEMLYGTTLTGLRANYTGSNGPIINVTFELTNTPDSSTLFNAGATYNVSDLWIYNTSGIVIEDSGEFVLKARCTDNDSVTVIYLLNWTLPWGNLEPYLITQNKNVVRNEFFTFSAGVNCIGGECGNISALLDPLSSEEEDYFRNIMNNLANSDSVNGDYNDGCLPASGTNYSCYSQRQQGLFISAYAKAYLSAKANNDDENASKYFDIMVNLADTDGGSGYRGECYPVSGTDYSCYCPGAQGWIIEGYADAYFAATKAGDAASASRFLDIMNNLANTDPETECTPATGGDYDCRRGGSWLMPHSVIISGYARAYEAASNAGDTQNASKYLDIMNNLANAVDYSGYSDYPGCHAFAIKAYADAYITAVEAADNGNATYYLAVMNNISKTDPSKFCAPVSGTDYSCENWQGDKKQGLMIFAYARAYEAATLAGDDENASLYLNITRNLANTTGFVDAICKPIEGTYSCNCAGNQQSLIKGYAQMQLMEGIDIKGAVPTTAGKKPFYTINNNPKVCPNMKGEDICDITWQVNATGDTETIWLFYTIFNPTTYTSYIQGNQTEIVNISINLDTTPPFYCGDGICNNGETCSTCSSDCGPCSPGGRGGTGYPPPTAHECENNNQCSVVQICEDYKCINLECAYCEYAKNHECKKYKCCKDADCKDGWTCKDHKCIKAKEQNETTIPDIKEDARRAITDARNFILRHMLNKDTSESETVLREAQSAFGKEDYEKAIELAQKAKALAETAPMKEAPKEPEDEFNWLLAFGILLLLTILALAYTKRDALHTFTGKHASKSLQQHKIRELEDYMDLARPIIAKLRREGKLDEIYVARLLEIEAEKDEAKKLLHEGSALTDEQIQTTVNALIQLKNDIESKISTQ